MFLLRAAIEHRGATSSSSSFLLLRSWPSRPLACAAGDGASLLRPGIGGEANSTRSSSPTGGRGGADKARAFSTTTNLVSGGGAFSPSPPSAPPPPPPRSGLLLRSFAADAARSLPDNDNSNSPAHKRSTKIVPIPLAQTGEGLKEVEIVSWRVAVGDDVEEFGPLCDVQSDKAAVEITSRFSGVVERLCYNEGDMVEVGATLCELRVEVEDEEDEAEERGGASEVGSVSPSSVSASDSSASSAPSTSPSHSISLASPAVRRVARELGFRDLSAIRGTGPGGRVLKEDVERAAASPPPPTPASAPASSAAAAAASMPENPAKKAASPPPPPPPLGTSSTGNNSTNNSTNENDVVVPLRGYRRAMVAAMTASLSVPHFHFMDEYPVDRLMEARRRLADDPTLQGTKLTLLPFVLKAISLTLASSERHAAVNASLSAAGDSLTLHADHNIGVAVDTPRGLVVPVVKRVQDLSVAEVAAELARLQSGLLAPSEGGGGGLLPESDLSGATLTVSNIGSLGGAWATPLVHPPQAAIVALGRVRPKLVLVEGGDEGEEARGGSSSGSSSSRSKGKQRHGAAAAGRDKKAAPSAPAPAAPSLSAVASLPMSWGADHRVVDGAGLAKFAAAVGALLSEPARMLLHSR